MQTDKYLKNTQLFFPLTYLAELLPIF